MNEFRALSREKWLNVEVSATRSTPQTLHMSSDISLPVILHIYSYTERTSTNGTLRSSF